MPGLIFCSSVWNTLSCMRIACRMKSLSSALLIACQRSKASVSSITSPFVPTDAFTASTNTCGMPCGLASATFR